MARNDVYDIIFDDVTGASMNVKLISVNSIPRAEMKAQALDIPGRSGYLTTTDTAYKSITIKATLRLKSNANRNEVSAWLTGQGDLRFTKYPTYMWKATVIKGFEFAPMLPQPFKNNTIMPGLDEFTVQFLCQPYRYVYPPVTLAQTNATTVTTMTVTNPGSVEAEPLIVIEGSGDVTLTVGSNVLEISDMDTGITIDTEARLAYNGDTNMTPNLNGDWPIIPTGATTISWTGEGSITTISIQPNWRDI